MEIVTSNEEESIVITPPSPPTPPRRKRGHLKKNFNIFEQIRMNKGRIENMENL